MRLFHGFLALALISTTCLAQKTTCNAGPAVQIDDRDGVTVQTVSLLSSSRKLTAHAFLPDRSDPVPAIAFSHSSIRYADSRVDLSRFAHAIARGGMAAILIDALIDEQTTPASAKIRMKDVACASYWLMSKAKLDLEHLAIGGPIRNFPEHVVRTYPYCPDPHNGPCGQFTFIAYWKPGYEENYTELMKTPEGQLWMIRDIPFGPKDVELEWLKEPVAPEAVAPR